MQRKSLILSLLVRELLAFFSVFAVNNPAFLRTSEKNSHAPALMRPHTHERVHLPRMHARTLANTRKRTQSHAAARKLSHLPAHLCTLVKMHTHTSAHMRKHLRTNARTYKHAHTRERTYTNVRTRANARTHKLTNVHAQTHAHTHTHTHTLLLYLLNYQIAETKEENNNKVIFMSKNLFTCVYLI